MHNYSFTRVSGNAKTGPIPVTMSSRSTCPDSCALKANGCYADAGMVRINWQKLDTKGLSLDALLASIQALPKGQLWRHNVAGDLPSIDVLDALTQANKGRKGFTYTHAFNDYPGMLQAVQQANEQGFTVNLSANSMQQADTLKALGAGPVVCLMPEDAPKVSLTPAGNTVTLCPATYRDDIQCSNCGLCAVATRKGIVGFPVHGTSKRKAHKVISLAVA